MIDERPSASGAGASIPGGCRIDRGGGDARERPSAPRRAAAGIRDAETEQLLSGYTAPILRAAGIRTRTSTRSSSTIARSTRS
jgi:hypothetical protein